MRGALGSSRGLGPPTRITPQRPHLNAVALGGSVSAHEFGGIQTFCLERLAKGGMSCLHMGTPDLGEAWAGSGKWPQAPRSLLCADRLLPWGPCLGS